LRITRHGLAASGVDEHGALLKGEETRDTRQGTELVLKTAKGRESLENFAPPPYRRGMIATLSGLVSLVSFR
jgi:hypothetical protein